MVPCILDTHAIGEPLTRVVTITAIVDLRLAIIPSGIREDNKVKYARRVGSERDIAAKLNLKLETSQRNTLLMVKTSARGPVGLHKGRWQ
jgi:hypothetical protein